MKRPGSALGPALAILLLAARPVWAGAEPEALLALIERAAEDGLDPEDYRRTELIAALARAPAAPAERAAIEGALLDAAALMLAHLRGGRVDPVTLAPRVIAAPELEARRTDLERAAGEGALPALAAAAAPTAGGYAALREVLAAYRQAAAADPGDRVRAARVRQLELNLETRRWLTPSRARKSVVVNIAGYALAAYEDGREVLRSRVVVGLPYRRTPVLSSALERVVLNPPWHVPPKIAREEILAAARRDPGYLAAHGFRVLSPDGKREVDTSTYAWTAMDPAELRLRFVQDPGPDNALGRVKLSFPNPWNVYLHDTPSRGLFERDARCMSHGCIRVERAVELAAWVLAVDGAALEADLAGGRTRGREVPERVDVDLVYWTAWVEPDGTVELFPDVYGRDARLARALARR